MVILVNSSKISRKCNVLTSRLFLVGNKVFYCYFGTFIGVFYKESNFLIKVCYLVRCKLLLFVGQT